MYEVVYGLHCADSSAMAASEALRLLYGDLVRVLQEVELLACDLYAEGIVPQKAVEDVRVLGITDAQKRLNLLALVTDQIAVHPERLDKFVQVLKKYPPIVEVAERLEETFREFLYPTVWPYRLDSDGVVNSVVYVD